METSPITFARVIGVLYLIIIVFGMFSEVYVRSSLIVRGDAEATAGNVLASEMLFRIGFASDLMVFLCDVAVAVILYVLFRQVNNTGALILTGFRLTGTAIYGVNLLNYFAALLLLNGSEYLKVFDSSQLNTLALVFLNLHRHGYDLGLVFFGLHCLVLGYLIVKAGFLPAVLGILMILAGIGYVVGSFTLFLFPEFTTVIAPIYIAPLIGELSLCLWLLIKGVRI